MELVKTGRAHGDIREECGALCFCRARCRARASETVCEACGAPGRDWGREDYDAACAAGASPPRWEITLCSGCGWRLFYEGARGRPAIRGDVTLDGCDGDGDLDDL